MVNCPCCSDQLLRHICSKNVYWFCRSCRQKMPVMGLKNCDLSLSMLTNVPRQDLKLGYPTFVKTLKISSIQMSVNLSELNSTL